MKARITIPLIALMGTLGMNAANAMPPPPAPGPVFVRAVPVTDVRPLYRWVRVNTPHQRCRYETVEHTHKSRTGALVGGLIGAAIGHRSGRHKGHRNRTNRAIAGGVAGAIIGNSIGNKRHTHVETHRVCRRHNHFHEERQVIGYRAFYRFRGRGYFTDMRSMPGRSIQIRFVGEPVY